MIDFRTFLVTVAAIFLSLAVGITLGAGPLKGELDTQLRTNVAQLGKDKEALRADLDSTKKLSEYRDTFAADAEPGMVAGRLTDRRVALVVLPGADGQVVKSLQHTLSEAGAQVTGPIQVTAKWVDPGQRQFVGDLAEQLGSASDAATDPVDHPTPTTPAPTPTATPGASAGASPTAHATPGRTPEGEPRSSRAGGSAYDRIGVVLASAILTRTVATGDRAHADPTVLGALAEGGLVEAPADLPRADLAVVVAASTPPANPALSTPTPTPEAEPGNTLGKTPGAGRAAGKPASTTSTTAPSRVAGADDDQPADPNQPNAGASNASKDADTAWIALARALDDAGSGSVVAGTSTTDPAAGLVGMLRADNAASEQVSSVDVADLPGGRVAVVWALVEQIAGKVGHYGAADGADAALPRLSAGIR